MVTTNFQQTLLCNHFDLLRNLNQEQKLELISWLSQSLKSTTEPEVSLRPCLVLFNRNRV